MRYYDEYPPYVPVAERRAKAEKQLQQLRKKHPHLKPVIIAGTQPGDHLVGEILEQQPGTVRRLQQPDWTWTQLRAHTARCWICS